VDAVQIATARNLPGDHSQRGNLGMSRLRLPHLGRFFFWQDVTRSRSLHRSDSMQGPGPTGHP
jgi:hypothetical protein